MAPGNAGVLALAAEGHRREGGEERAAALDRLALALDPLERRAFRGRLAQIVDGGSDVQLIEALELAGRRWPGERHALWASARARTGSPAFREALVGRLAASPAFRKGLIHALNVDADNAELGAEILIREAMQGREANEAETASAVNALVANREMQEAHTLFRQTMTPAERELVGPVHDPTFRLGAGRHPFRWTIDTTSAAELTHVEHGLRLRLRDAPTRLGTVRQVVALAPGHYRMRVIAAATGLHLPDPLFWNVTCVGPYGERARVVVPPGSYPDLELAADFTIDSDCAFQQLTLLTAQKGRPADGSFSGEVTFASVRIEAR